jgi:hypothetical protein
LQAVAVAVAIQAVALRTVAVAVQADIGMVFMVKRLVAVVQTKDRLEFSLELPTQSRLVAVVFKMFLVLTVLFLEQV